ncbi:penicillin acylase family protein [Kamptonema cortianum]|nr:penicillin acylase family protein [Geitlerinema splendidum]MDK3156297.1 penicillin acylase family protein [Kamptonema cortianum]
MLSVTLGFVLLTSPATSQASNGIFRDTYGVPIVRANSQTEAFRLLGRAVAEDRLWQMEMSRRLARGKLAEVLGPAYINSDKDILKKAYTDTEYMQMFQSLPEDIRESFTAYAAGVNDVITNRRKDNSLPEGYEKNGFDPAPWTVIDSCAIGVNLARQFGQGGAGELRNYALVQYLKLRPVKNQLFDALDDLAWQLDSRSPSTVSKLDEIPISRPEIWEFTREDSEQHLSELPATSLFELIPAVRMASMTESELIAEHLGAPFKVGSYAIAVSQRRSSNGRAMLLTAPQMGHTVPSIVHECAIDTPKLKVAGMDVPGIPGVIIGYTPSMAWGLTSGVADLEDVFVSKLIGENEYLHAGKRTELDKVSFTLKIKGQPDEEFVQYRTVHGPVLLLSKGSSAVYSLKSAFWKRELAGIVAINNIYSAASPTEVSSAVADLPVSFNLFFALKSGDIGYRYGGFMPIRAKGIDPRLPTPDEASNQWRGFLAPTQMPRVDNPRNGLLANWNNRPTDWWPNGDTPVWGRTFRNSELLAQLTQEKLSGSDLEAAAKAIAKRETGSNSELVPYFRAALESRYGTTLPPAAKLLAEYDGWRTAGSAAARLYDSAANELRKSLFLPVYGNFTAENLFTQILQPHTILEALDGKTKINYLSEKSQKEHLLAAFDNAVASLEQRFGTQPSAWGYVPGTIPVASGEPIPYNNRGTYIQITELGEWAFARSVASPGVSESGEHSNSQAPLAREWRFKPMWGWE